MATKIEWTEATWNPVVGCSKVSPGCAHCYAETMSKRLASMAAADVNRGRDPGRKQHYQNVIDAKDRWNGRVEIVEEALTEPLRWKKPRRVFVNSMSDLFHPDVPFEFVDRVFAVMALCPQHSFQVLTKRPERMAEYLQQFADNRTHLSAYGVWASDMATWAVGNGLCEPADSREEQSDDVYDRLLRAFGGFNHRGYLPNVWLGTSVENQQAADERIPHLLRCPAAVRFLSAEPLLGPIILDQDGTTSFCHYAGGVVLGDCGHVECRDRSFLDGIDWVIAGAESGRNARAMDEDWVRSLRDQCQAAGSAFFYKQNAVNGRKIPTPALDGRRWMEFPEPTLKG